MERKVSAEVPFLRHSRENGIKILTYNVHSCIGSDAKASPERIAEVIADCGADVVALQELDVGRRRTGAIDQARSIAIHLGMEMYFNPAIRIAEEQYGDAILTSLDMRLVKSAPLPSLAEQRGALWVEVEWNGRPVQIINTHLGLSRRDRSGQVSALLGPAWLGHPDCTSPRILLGDFNAVRSSLAYRQIAARLDDAWRSTDAKPARTFPARLPLLRLDHIFVDRTIHVREIGVLQSRLARTASDHLPLFARLEFRAADARAAVDRTKPGRKVLFGAEDAPSAETG